jgi:hypothetical protein
MRRLARGALLNALLWAILSGPVDAAEDGLVLQDRKEEALVAALKKLVACKNQGIYKTDGDLYCFLTFRGLRLEFAGVNSKDGGGAIYVYALGKNQRLDSLGSRCIRVAFDDADLRGIGAAHIIFRNDGVITYNASKASAECR